MAIEVRIPSRPKEREEVTLTLDRKDAEVLRRLMHSHVPGGDANSLPKRIDRSLEAVGVGMAERRNYYS